MTEDQEPWKIVDLAARRRPVTYEELDEKLRELRELIKSGTGPALQEVIEGQGSLREATHAAYVELEARVAALEQRPNSHD